MDSKKLLGTSTYSEEDRAQRQYQENVKYKIVHAYKNPIIRWYSRLRFHIINLDFLNAIEQHLPQSGRVLDIGCGFGLFSLYYALLSQDRQIVGFDLDLKRIQEAQETAQRLNITNVQFFCQDATTFSFTEHYDCIVTLDLLHHVSPEVAENLLRSAYEYLKPNGILIVKDITTRPFYKLYFTFLLDKIMMPKLPVHYRSASEWQHIMKRIGFNTVHSYKLNDYLPYPHVLLIAYKH